MNIKDLRFITSPASLHKNNLEISPSRIRNLFFQATQQLSTHSCFLDLSTLDAFVDRIERKDFKNFLPIFIEEKKTNDLILLKISNQYPDLLKYVLENGFKFKEANEEFSLLNYHYKPKEVVDSKENKSPLEITRAYHPKNQTISEIMIKDSIDNPKVPQAPRMDIAFLLKKISLEEQKNYHSQICSLNPHRTDHDVFSNKFWDVEYYNQENYPVILGTINDQEIFSLKRNGLGLRFLDMPIHMPCQGWRIPAELKQFEEVIDRAIAFEKHVNPDFEKTCYVYITVDQGEVEPHQAQRRTGWHGDSYLKINSKKNDSQSSLRPCLCDCRQLSNTVLTWSFSFKRGRS